MRSRPFAWSWNRVLALGCVVLTTAAGSVGGAGAPDGAAPNVVVFLIDDLGWADVGCFGNDFAETPNVDRLAGQGMRFTRAYAACPVCSPTRASFLTGKYPARLNLTDWIPGRKDRPDQTLLGPEFLQALPLEEETIAERLAQAGYDTASLGKWHLGGEGFGPADQGFALNIAGTAKGSPPGYFAKELSPGRWGFDLPGLREGGHQGEYLTDRLAAEAARYIKEHRDRPFFLYLPHFAVHIPIQPRPDLLKKYEEKARGRADAEDVNPHYAAMIESMDEAVGTVLDALDEAGLADRTMVIFTSDNGGLAAKEGPHTPATSNGPLRAGKGHLYEGGIRVPLIVRRPGVVAAGTECRTPVITTDLLPTICAAAGRADRAADGVSLAPLLNGSGRIEREALFWHYPHYSNQGGAPGGAVRRGDRKLIEFYEDGHAELYDLAHDPGEARDLARENPDEVAALRSLLHDWRTAVGARMPVKKAAGGS